MPPYFPLNYTSANHAIFFYAHTFWVLVGPYPIVYFSSDGFRSARRSVLPPEQPGGGGADVPDVGQPAGPPPGLPLRGTHSRQGPHTLHRSRQEHWQTYTAHCKFMEYIMQEVTNGGSSAENV